MRVRGERDRVGGGVDSVWCMVEERYEFYVLRYCTTKNTKWGKGIVDGVWLVVG